MDQSGDCSFLGGKQSDRKVAKRLGISPATAQNKRLELDIASYQPPQKRIEWTAEMISLLGAISDLNFARRFDITKDSVKRKRDQFGISPHRYKSQAIQRTAVLAKLLRSPNRELRTRYGITKETALKQRREFGMPTPDSRNQHWTSARLKQLGRVPDPKLAKAIGLTPGSVGYKRRALGIPPKINKKPWSEKELALFAKLSDEQIAARTGRSLFAVKAKRRTLNHRRPRG